MITWDLQMFGGRGAESGVSHGGTNLSPAMEAHFRAENKKIKELMAHEDSAVTMSDGSILEHYTMKQLKDQAKEAREYGAMWQDNSMAFLYSDGRIEVYGEGDDTSGIRLTGLKGIIVTNDTTQGYAGKGIVITNDNEIYAGERIRPKPYKKWKKGTGLSEETNWEHYGASKDEDLWRIDFA